MPDSIRFLDVNNVLLLHRQTLEREGGQDGVLNYGLLEAAVAMPRQQFGGEYLHPDLPAMAAAYLFHLNKNHAFLDGNKRVSLLAASTFLIVNGLELTAPPEEAERVTLAVAAGEISKDELIAWMSGHIRPLQETQH